MERIAAPARVPGMEMSAVIAVPIQDAPRVFEEFYVAHNDRVYRALAITLGDTDLAREATDEAMARVYARW